MSISEIGSYVILFSGIGIIAIFIGGESINAWKKGQHGIAVGFILAGLFILGIIMQLF